MIQVKGLFEFRVSFPYNLNQTHAILKRWPRVAALNKRQYVWNPIGGAMYSSEE